ncbi:signal peptidase I [Rhodococcus pseudokoreensis]|uniref:Signal peptidase I n=1 Tax=Rhodococcus pseudokoreensis TaxID=2811421 RepID=A0A974ZWQ9_9NOCA|nr:signal peptidase I [Rhodococcus pseudokoreensis]QSE93291.1 signal peptidase I [Rhodococcus pseudokoreensis]
MDTTTTPPGTDHTGPLWWVRTIASWVLLLTMCAILVVTILIPMVAGAQRFTVLTGSMTPTYPPGTLLVVTPADPGTLGVGTAITYQIESGRPAVVTHRIVAVEQNTIGERTFLTQGDANRTPDEKPVRGEQIRGRVWYSVPYLGHVNSWLTGQQRTWILGAVVTGLFGYAAYMFLSGVRDGRREKVRDDA